MALGYDIASDLINRLNSDGSLDKWQNEFKGISTKYAYAKIKEGAIKNSAIRTIKF